MSEFFLKKMETVYAVPVNYYLTDKSGNKILLNNWLGKNLKISFNGEINCVKCGRPIKKTYGEGFCYQCFTSAPEADVCVVQPEKCRAHEGISRDMKWSETHCLRPHYVYLAKTSAIKVGVTRMSQIPTRWIDQGADFAVKLAKTPYRQLAGLIEVEMKKYFTDKTSWQSMLKNISTEEDLVEAKQKAINLMPDEFKKFIVEDNFIWKFHYPVKKNPEKIVSLKLNKQPVIQGKLTAIKGQYLIFENQYVINIRSHSGYNIKIEL